MRDIFIEIWTTVKHNRLRTALTGFSVAWGIFILIVLLGAGNGLINGIMGNRMNVLTNSMSIYGGQTSKAYDGLGEGRNVELNDKDLAITQHGFESNIDDVGAEIEKSGLNIAYGDNYSTGVSVNGVYPNDVDINKRDMLCGRFLNALDIEQRRKTIVVSQGLAKELMPHAPLNLNGHVVKVDNLAFTVVGIYDSDKPIEEIVAGYKEFYKDAKFTHYVDKAIDLKQVVNTNKCLVHVDKYGDKLLITSCIDNLLKGAVGQAVQNMNIMFGLDQTAGLKLKPSAF